MNTTKTILVFGRLLAVLALLIIMGTASAQVSTDSLILDMPMNGDATDYSGFGNHGTLHNVVADTNRFGTPNSSYMFNGTDSYIEIPASPSMNAIQTVDAVTITAWININQWHISGNVFSIFERYNPDTDSGWLLEANWVGGGILFLADESNPTNYAGCNFTWNFDQWYHLGFTYGAAQGTADFYINGENVCSTSYSPPINVADTTSSFIIGQSLAGPDEFSDGHIDDYKIYYRILTPDEIDTIFTTGINDHPDRSLSSYEVYPNPAEDLCTIRADYALKGSVYSLTDITGRNYLSRQITQEFTTLRIGDLPAGIYLLRVGSELSTRKIIKL